VRWAGRLKGLSLLLAVALEALLPAGLEGFLRKPRTATETFVSTADTFVPQALTDVAERHA
jgi:hypothetical protein